MKNRMRQADSGTGLQQPPVTGRRGFLQQAGLAAVVAGGLEVTGVSRAAAATAPRGSAIPRRSAVPPSRNVGAVYPRTGRPGPGAAGRGGPGDITWYLSPGSADRVHPDQEASYFWYDSGTGEYGGPVRA